MIRIKLSVDENVKEILLPITKDTIAGTFYELSNGLDISFSLKQNFHVVINGNISEQWDKVKVSSDDDILITPKLLGGEDVANIGRILLVIAAIYTGGKLAALIPKISTAGTVAITTTAGVLGQMLAFAAFPPAQLQTNNGLSLERSQSFNFTGQSNRPNQFGFVPKVYGTHRIFPYVAATPYIELGVIEGKQVQYLHAVYDFGLGPNVLSDIRIGDTPIFEFDDLFYQIVDFNRPLTNEGAWDDGVASDLAFYKGDVTVDQVSVLLDRNESGGGSPANYEIIRNTPVNSENDRAEISVNGVFANGLSSFASSGAIGFSRVNFRVEFALISDPENWFRFNDTTRVENFSFSENPNFNGANLLIQNSGFTPFASSTPSFEGGFLTGFFSGLRVFNSVETGSSGTSGNITRTYTATLGVNNITNSIIVDRDVDISIFSKLFFGKINQTFGGNAVSKQFVANAVGDGRDGWRITLNSYPLNFALGQITYTSVGSGSNWTITVQSVSNIQAVGFQIANIAQAFVQATANEPYYFSFKFTPIQRGQYRVRLVRESEVNQFSFQTNNAMTVTSVQTRFDRAPIVTDKRHTFLELKIRATNQLNGAIQNLSAIASSVLERYNGTAWVKEVTNNPAWVFADILTGAINKKAIPKTRLDLPSLLEWEEFCNEVPNSIVPFVHTQPRFQTNFVFDYESTVTQLISQVTSGAQASFNIIDGNYGVLIDKRRTTPVQIFTPRNSSNFSSTKVFAKVFDAVTVKFADASNGFEQAELTVYQDGFNELTAVEIEEIQAFACTNREQAYRYGRFLLAQNKLRQEIYSIEVDFEHLVCLRGDYVRLVQDVARLGGVSARVKSVSGNQIVINEGLTTDPLKTYSYSVRRVDGIYDGDVLNFISADTIELDGPMPNVGDLIVIGETNFVYYDCTVKSIEPINNLKANLILIEKADPIYDAELGGSIPSYNPGIATAIFSNDTPPPEVVDLVVVDNDWRCVGQGYEYYIDLDWDVPVGAAFDIFEIYVNAGSGFDFVAFTKASEYEYIVNPINLNIEHQFKILAVSATGVKLDLGEVSAITATPERKITPPSDVTSLGIDITDEVLQLSWPPVSDCDIQDYLIRYSPDVNGLWNSSVPLLRVGRDTTLASVQARTGVYLIKAVDWNGNESLNETRAVTTIPNLFNLNIIEETSDFPTLLGATDRVSVSTNTLLLSESVSGAPEVTQYFNEGYYYYENLLELGEIYTVRLQALITAEGYTPFDVMSNWTTLADLLTLSSAGSSDWDVEIEYRTSESFITMDTWDTLADVETLTLGVPDNWSPWRKITAITDATGRIFQFRVRLISNRSSVTPRIFDAVVRADMPDRDDSINNVLVPDTGLTINYTPGFYGPVGGPNIQVSIDNAEAGDYWEITNRTVDSFDIQFFNINGDPVARNADFRVKGYGRKSLSVI